jgi:hypothetical protein
VPSVPQPLGWFPVGDPAPVDLFAGVGLLVDVPTDPTMRAAGWLGGTMHAVVDDPDKVVEISEWESVQARDAAMAGMMGSFGPLFEMLAGPFKAP